MNPNISCYADFREFRFTSEVPIWLDYHGKHVVIEQVSQPVIGPEAAWLTLQGNLTPQVFLVLHREHLQEFWSGWPS